MKTPTKISVIDLITQKTMRFNKQYWEVSITNKLISITHFKLVFI